MYRSMGWDKARGLRFEKQKELGIMPSNMSLPIPHLPPLQPWDTLSTEQKNHAAMIENLDKNIGKVIQYLKNTGQYDNTIIIFTSDNGTSEPFEMDQFKYANGVDLADAKQFTSTVNNSLVNVGNQNSDINYGPWGPYVTSSPFSASRQVFLMVG